MTAATLPAPPKLRETSSLPALIDREKRRRRRRVLVWSFLGLALVATVVAIVIVTRPRPVPIPARFRLAALTEGPLVREVRATGTVDAVSTVAVGAEISGRVATVEADFNQQVKAGQVLARFDMTALEAQRAQSAALALTAKAQLAQARSDLEQARRNKARADSLFAQQALSATEHESAITALSVSESRVAAAEATVAAQTALATVAKTNLDHAVIRSPIDGVIITRNVDPGQTVASVMTTPTLFTVAADLRKMEVLAAIDEADIAELRLEQPATFTVTAWPGRTFSGVVTEVRNAPRLVQDVVTYGVVISVDNLDLALRPGMTASVRIQTGAAKGRQVPNAALRFTPPGEAKAEGRVWLLEGERLVSQAVRPGLSDGEQTVVETELPVGAKVLVDLTPEGKKAYGLGAH
ncbi:MAG: efflux RND transporter periplasmic adaptor subunit [Myxococcota bacterium]